MTVFDQVNEKLLAAEAAALQHHAGNLLERGATLSEANASLQAYRADLEAWRKNSLARIGRMLDEPNAPSHVVH